MPEPSAFSIVGLTDLLLCRVKSWGRLVIKGYFCYIPVKKKGGGGGESKVF